MKKKNKKKLIMNKKASKGFTLIEIIAAIAILGILSTIAVISVNKIIQEGKKKHYETAEKNLKLAGQSYAQDNRNILPKVVGQKTKVYLSTLQEKKYINEVLDYNENECENSTSYVQIYKYSQSDYSYFSYIDCPSYKTSIDEKISAPTINITMSGVKKDAEAKIEITDENKLMSYSYIIYKGTKEILNSGSIVVKNYAKRVDTTINLNKYTPGQIKIIVTATNIYGNSTTKTVTNNFEDTSPPVCKIKEEDTKPKPWISEGSRKITVECDDGNGSGCTRESFTKVFKDSAMTDYITISDESGNTAQCEVTVYIDKEKPSITVNAYKRTASGGKTGKVLASQSVSHTSPNATLDLSTLNTTTWLNKTNYPNGIYYEVKYSDDVYLASYNVKENQAGLSTSTIDAATTIIQNKTTDKKSVTDSYSTDEDGYRTYIITANDIAGNSINISVKTPLDRVAPSVPTISTYKWTNNTTKPTSAVGLSAYTNDTWSDLNIYTTASSSTDAISGFKEYQVTTSGTTTNVTNSTQSYRSVESEGISYISYRACDIAGNCSKHATNKTIKIDKHAPSCLVSGGSTTWTNGSRTITARCEDSGSGCATDPFSKTYNTQMSTTTAGAVDNNNGGVVYDIAGNSTSCPANQTVRIDKTDPSCSVSGGSTDWTNSSRTITATCSDTGGSGCATEPFSKKYSTTMTTTTAGAVDNNNGGVVYDIAGNSTSCPANQTVKIDKVPPTCTTSGGSSTWTNGNRYLTGTCSDTGGSGCVSNSYKEYNTNTNTTSANPGNVSDEAGNTASCPNATVKIDKTAPSCNVTGGSSTWTNGSRTITATCSDTGGSGCVTEPFSKKYSSNINTTTAGALGDNSGGTVYDNAGNSKNCSANQTVKIDKTNPTITNIYNPSGGNATAPGLVLTLYGYDTGGSGMSHWRYSYNGYSWNKYSSSGYTGYQTTSFTTIRNQTVYIGLCDNADNCVSDSTYVNIIDPCTSTTTTWNSWGSCSKNCGGGTRKRTGTKYSDLISGYSCGDDSETESCNTQSCDDEINDTRYYDCDSYYITTCNTTTCNYTKKNGVSSSGTISRNSLTTSRGNCDKTYCNPYISSRSGSVVKFTVSPQNSQCKVKSYSTGSCSKEGSGDYYVKAGYSSISDGSYCNIKITFYGIAYVWQGSEYSSASWKTYKCSSSKYCTQDCNRNSPCV